MDTGEIANTPEPPYYAVIFTSVLGPDHDGYYETAARMAELVAESPGYLGHESARGEDRLGITVAYFRDEDSIRTWRDNAEHAAARARGRAEWYDGFELRIAKVERAYGFRRAE
ncbi:antibiotic biosynthesis monooxygenase [Alloactinosynnema sp. L-07]|uniref:antibiotic biosynthesis monooxygenase family protein n=1 Tax=Alloactinosynnema sp. L-07 TaxID=1653480 RepID=UPI0006B52715|nr:antibiotic biosynthesis monooxygenase [Alloactinosynnema sp. L-07]